MTKDGVHKYTHAKHMNNHNLYNDTLTWDFIRT